MDSVWRSLSMVLQGDHLRMQYEYKKIVRSIGNEGALCGTGGG
jgi:hypothetical protein